MAKNRFTTCHIEKNYKSEIVRLLGGKIVGTMYNNDSMIVATSLLTQDSSRRNRGAGGKLPPPDFDRKSLKPVSSNNLVLLRAPLRFLDRTPALSRIQRPTLTSGRC